MRRGSQKASASGPRILCYSGRNDEQGELPQRQFPRLLPASSTWTCVLGPFYVQILTREKRTNPDPRFECCKLPVVSCPSERVDAQVVHSVESATQAGHLPNLPAEGCRDVALQIFEYLHVL